ncbi:unnamed protein product, partial [Sphenostylis stenocarpa]
DGKERKKVKHNEKGKSGTVMVGKRRGGGDGVGREVMDGCKRGVRVTLVVGNNGGEGEGLAAVCASFQRLPISIFQCRVGGGRWFLAVRL